MNKPSTELPLAVYENLCWYCAFIKRLSPFAKAAAPADFIIQLDMELENGRDDTLREVLKFPEEVIQFYRREHVLGRKVKAIDAIHFGRYGEALTNFDYVLTIDPTADTSRALAVACAIEIGNMPKAQQLNTNYAIGDGRWKQWADGKMMLATNAIQQGTEKYVSLAKKYPTFMNSAFIAQGNHILRKIDWVTYSKLMQVTNNTASSNSK